MGKNRARGMTEADITKTLCAIVAADTPMARIDAMMQVQQIVSERAYLLAELRRWRKMTCRCLGFSHDPPDHLSSCPILRVDEAIAEVGG